MNPDHLHRTEQAIAGLTAAGLPVTFTAVAVRAGIGRATLYREPSLRELINSRRRDASSEGTLTGLAKDIAALRIAIEAVAARVRRHEEQIRQLNQEKKPTRTQRQ